VPRIIHRKRVILVAAFAVLFSALSPALAALKYRGQSVVLAQICSIHGLQSVPLDGKVDPRAPLQHQIHCAWCSASATQPGTERASVQIFIPTLLTYSPPLVFIENTIGFSAPIAFYRSQAPPVLV
jgi:hypothetical protein